MEPYIVRQGEHLTAIAARRGFAPDDVWQAPENAALRRRRADYDRLAPGDVIHVPRQPPPAHELAARRTNRFRGRCLNVPVRLSLSFDDEPLANEVCVVEGLQPELETRTDGAGVLAFDAPAHLASVRVRLPDRDLTLDVRVGDLDPPDERSGVAQRLAHLGYLTAGDLSLAERYRQPRVETALRRFQKDRGMEPSGEIDTDTARALERAAGR